jgi:hypothetical protein
MTYKKVNRPIVVLHALESKRILIKGSKQSFVYYYDMHCGNTIGECILLYNHDLPASKM